MIAGEASGDLHASNLIKALYQQDTEASVRAWGGDLMEASGAVLAKHIKELAFMGFAEVILNINTILGNIKYCKKDILAWKPDALILVDYPGFNLRIAKWAKKQGIKVIYYISPQIWAWHESRVHQIKQNVDLMLVILPFEQAFYKKYGYDVQYVGHPLLDVISSTSPDLIDKKTVALLPGSRRQEIKKMLPEMLNMCKYFSEYEFALACAPAIPDEFYDKYLTAYPQVKRFKGKTYNLLKNAHAALVTSGTATLETALFGVPQVVCYKGGTLSYLIAKNLIKIKYISLVNLIMDEEVVKELIQDKMNEKNLKNELQKILNDKNRFQIESKYHILRQKLGDKGASLRAAAKIVDFLEKLC